MSPQRVWARCSKLLLVVLLSVSSGHTTNPQSSEWYVDYEFQNRLATEADTTSNVSSRNSLDCGRKCYQKITCNSFFYNDESKQCWLQTTVFLSASDTLHTPGFRYYRLKSDLCPLAEGYMVHRESATCFRPVMQPLKGWAGAIEYCEGLGGSLAILHPVSKLVFLINHLVANPTVYRKQEDSKSFLVGLHRPYLAWNTPYTEGKSDYQWLDGSPLNLTLTQPYWTDDSPSGSNVATLRPRFNFLLDDVVDAQRHRRFVCQKTYRG